MKYLRSAFVFKKYLLFLFQIGNASLLEDGVKKPNHKKEQEKLRFKKRRSNN